MSMRQRLEVRQTQSLSMTPQMRQALKMLAAPAVELTAMLAEAVETNPLLELDAPALAPRAAPPPAVPRGAGTAVDWAERVPDRPSLHAYLAAQLACMRLSPAERLVAESLAAELDESGYLRGDDDALAARLGASRDVLEGALDALRACEPTGVGARDLAECLRLQLAEADALDPAMEALLVALPDAPDLPASELARLCGVRPRSLEAMLARLRALDPRPGLRFGEGLAASATPELRARPDATGGWVVELVAETAPKLLLDRDYAARVAPGARGEAKKFLSDCARDAGFLIRALDQRARTMVKIAAEIVAAQSGFLEEGAQALRPLTLREIAEAAEVHESTVSRVVADKFIDTPRGLLPLRVFFSAALSAGADGEARAAGAAQARIKALIAAEDKRKPLSDDALARMLKAEGIAVARRTVMKYREALGIDSSVGRRRRAASALCADRPSVDGPLG